MVLLNTEIKQKLITSINNNISINKISKKLNLAKSTIYYHYKKIKGRKFNKPTIPKDDRILGEFMGIFAGDGNFFFDKKRYQYRISIYFHMDDDKNYANYVKDLIEKNFNKKVQIYYSPQDHLLTIRIYSKDIFIIINDYLNIYPHKTHNIHIKKPINKLSNKFLTAFVRGIVDTDGHHKKDGRIVLCLVSKKMIDQVSLILKTFNIHNKIYIRNKKPPEAIQYELTIPRREVIKYLDIIGFSNKRKKCAGRESNSRSKRFSGLDVGNVEYLSSLDKP